LGLLCRPLAALLCAVAACPVVGAAEPSESTTGTASTVSPSIVAVGGTLTYTLSGFPPGAAIQILVDDGIPVPGGQTAEQDVIGGAVVDEDGITSGVVELPDYIAKGPHWLRFEVSAGQDVPTNKIRTLDYTNKSPYFTVGDVTIIAGAPAAPGVGSARPPATAEPTPGLGTEDAADDSRTTQVDIVAEGEDTQAPAIEVSNGAFPLVGTLIFAIALLLAVLAVVVVVCRRRLARRQDPPACAASCGESASDPPARARGESRTPA